MGVHFHDNNILNRSLFGSERKRAPRTLAHFVLIGLLIPPGVALSLTGANDTNPVCVTKAQLAALLGAAAIPAHTKSVTSSAPPDLTDSGNADNANQGPDANASSTLDQAQPPVIQINGENPAVIQVGDTYNDLGATIVSPDADKNLGIKTFLNGKLASNIVLDTTEAATDTIDYVLTDPTGLTATSTRTILIQAPAGTSPAIDTSTLDATSLLPMLDSAPPLVPNSPATTTLQARSSSPQ